MKRPIVSVPEKFGGELHIEGTSLTISELQSYWRQAGVGAAQMRDRFPELTESELGAAVTYAEPQEPEFSFSADVTGHPKKRLHIYGAPGNWMFVRNDVDGDKSEFTGWDVWEASFEAIIRYPAEHGPLDIIWRDDRSGDIVDLHSLRFEEGS